MREAILGGLSALDDPRPRAASGKSNPGKPAARPRPDQRETARAGRSAKFRRFRAKVMLVGGSACFSAIMIGIVLNATVMQRGHHPAPLFASPAPAPVAARVDLPPPPPPAPPAMPAAPVEPAAAIPAPPPSLAPPAPAPVRHAAAPHARTGDAIARLLGAGAKPAAVPASTRVAPTTTHAKAAAAARPKAALPVVAVKPHATTAVN